MTNAAGRVLELFQQQQPKRGVAGVTGVTRQLVTLENPMITPVTPVTPQKQHSSAGESVLGVTTAPWGDAEEERAAIVEYDGGAPCIWAEALARLDPKRPPCDMSPKRWLQFIDDCGRFLDEGWATRAEALGWGPLDLFGCDSIKPIARLDRAGLLWLIDGRRLLALTADTAAIATASGSGLTFRRCPNEPGRSLVWDLEA